MQPEHLTDLGEKSTEHVIIAVTLPGLVVCAVGEQRQSLHTTTTHLPFTQTPVYTTTQIKSFICSAAQK